MYFCHLPGKLELHKQNVQCSVYLFWQFDQLVFVLVQGAEVSSGPIKLDHANLHLATGLMAPPHRPAKRPSTEMAQASDLLSAPQTPAESVASSSMPCQVQPAANQNLHGGQAGEGANAQSKAKAKAKSRVKDVSKQTPLEKGDGFLFVVCVCNIYSFMSLFVVCAQ